MLQDEAETNVLRNKRIWRQKNTLRYRLIFNCIIYEHLSVTCAWRRCFAIADYWNHENCDCFNYGFYWNVIQFCKFYYIFYNTLIQFLYTLVYIICNIIQYYITTVHICKYIYSFIYNFIIH